MGVSSSIRIGFAVCLCASTIAVAARRKATATVSPWQQAEQMRQSLEAQPAQERTRASYTRVLDAYRAIYHTNPADLHAPGAIFAVGELLAEQGRGQSDTNLSQKALGQFEFLRKQYPGSSLRVTALLAEGIIAQNDLRDAALAKQKYSELLKRYPRSSEANDARTGLAQLKTGLRPLEAAPAAAKSAPQPVPTVGDAGSVAANAAVPPASASGAQLTPAAADTPAPPRKRGGLAVVSGIRHWSTPDYTRVAIDLGDEVKYEAARVPRPERIFFDLHGTRLAQELVGKNFTVTDDGFLKRIRAAQFSNDVTRVVLDVSDVTEYSAFLLPNPYRLIIDIHGSQKDTAKQPAQPAVAKPTPLDAAENGPQTAQSASAADLPPTPSAERVVAPVPNVPSTVATKTTTSHEVANLGQQPGKVNATAAPTSQPIAASVKPVIETDEANPPAPPTEKKGRKAGKKNAVMEEPIGHMAVPTATGETSLVRALGLKIGRIVIDAGHGGHDSGTLGVDGLMEKDVVLDVALRLGKLLHDRLGAEIVYTRSDDTFIPLETRTAIANKAQADLFLSIHANSSSDASARGVETYYLNFTSQPDALEVAARENAVSNQSISQLSDLVKKIALKDKIEESREFAFNVEQSLYGGLQKGNEGLKNRGIKKAPFVVLIGANMPSILTEISFVTNPRDASQLRQAEYRQRIAESIYKGVARYAGGLSGMKLAQGSGSGSNAKSSGN